ncbi:MAG: phosphoribosylaminoimidazolesuccinocarboxamide synthase [Candidatus Aenigmatarchaeota archaeon]
MMDYPLIKQGKTRDVFDAGNGKLLFNATDRISAFDVLLADKIPRKGEVLNSISLYHLKVAQIYGVPTHFYAEYDKKGMFVHKLDMIPIEVIVRGYLYGSAWDRYREGSFKLPSGTKPRKGARFFEPVVEFTTKLEAKDRPATIKEIIGNKWATDEEVSYMIATAKKVHEITSKGARIGRILVADQKLEFGRSKVLENVPILGDEVCTPDSARLWDAALYQECYESGRDQPSYDKQFVRDHLLNELHWDQKRPPAGTKLAEPILSREVVAKTSQKYLDARTRIIDSGSGDEDGF